MSQQVTGVTAFWAVLALALNAMARPSFTSKRLYDETGLFNGALLPHLSSPVVCLVDCLFDLLILAKVLIKACSKHAREGLPPPGSSTPTERPKHDSIAVRMVLFVLGGLPQAIKVFGMRGLPITQTISAIFLASTILGAITGAIAGRFEEEKKEIDSWMQANPRRSDLLKTFVLTLHVVGAAVIWNLASGKIGLPQNNTNVNIAGVCLWISVISSLLGLLAAILWILAMFFTPLACVRLARLQLPPLFASLPVWMLLGYPQRLLETEKPCGKRQCDLTVFTTIFWDTIPALLIVVPACYRLPSFVSPLS